MIHDLNRVQKEGNVEKYLFIEKKSIFIFLALTVQVALTYHFSTDVKQTMQPLSFSSMPLGFLSQKFKNNHGGENADT